MFSKKASTVSHKATQGRPVAIVKNGSLLRKQSHHFLLGPGAASVQDCSPWHGRNSQGQGTKESREENGVLSQGDWFIPD